MLSRSTILSFFLLACTSIVSAYPTESSIDARGLSIQVAAPASAAYCPATNNGNARNYEAHVYSENQVQAAFIAAAKYAASGKQIGANDYPHAFGNDEQLPFDCGASKQEFPLVSDGTVYSGQAAAAIPDRIVFEYKAKGNTATVKFCGVMRHGPGADFLKC